MIGWALRLALLCCGIALGISFVWGHRAAFFPGGVPDSSQHAVATAARPVGSAVTPSDMSTDSLVLQAGPFGQFSLDASVNGAPIHFVVDTGASFVALTPEDARAAGINPDQLSYTMHAHTANGVVAMAPVMLNEVRINQLSVSNVMGTVPRSDLSQSLLGMSFLNRLKSYEIRDGRLIISW
jgi:clan AA aspartic protease (TIGR02281 family)